MPASGVESVGMDPNTGLLLVLHAGEDRGNDGPGGCGHPKR